MAKLPSEWKVLLAPGIWQNGGLRLPACLRCLPRYPASETFSHTPLYPAPFIIVIWQVFWAGGLVRACDGFGGRKSSGLRFVNGSSGCRVRIAKSLACSSATASCDRLFEMLQAYLISINIAEASRVLFVADGAAWIWRRIPKLIRALQLQEEQVQQLIDFWHAVEYLGKIAESRKLTGSKRKHWVTIQKKRLLRGEIGSVVIELKNFLSARRTRAQTTWLNYFITHGLTYRRMDYSTSRSHHLPIGSGAVESAIRRVINLRVKSNSTYWLRENAETMIRLRAWLKAGRAEELFQQTTYNTINLAA